MTEIERLKRWAKSSAGIATLDMLLDKRIRYAHNDLMEFIAAPASDEVDNFNGDLPEGFTCNSIHPKKSVGAAIEEGMAHVRFYFKFWLEKVEWAFEAELKKAPWLSIRIDGTHYHFLPENSYQKDTGRFKGFGGAHQHIQITEGANKGALLATDNLWCQGDIPKLFRDYLLKDNARFLSRDEYVTLQAEAARNAHTS